MTSPDKFGLVWLLLQWRFYFSSWDFSEGSPSLIQPPSHWGGLGHSSGDVWQRWDDNKNEKEGALPYPDPGCWQETKHDNKLDNSSSQSKQYGEWTCCGARWLMRTIKMLVGSRERRQTKFPINNKYVVAGHHIDLIIASMVSYPYHCQHDKRMQTTVNAKSSADNGKL